MMVGSAGDEKSKKKENPEFENYFVSFVKKKKGWVG
jgi:hypothetical protein